MERRGKSGKGWSKGEEGRAGRGSFLGYWDRKALEDLSVNLEESPMDSVVSL